MPRSVRVSGSVARSKIHRGKRRVIGKIPPGNRKKIVRPGTVIINGVNGAKQNHPSAGLNGAHTFSTLDNPLTISTEPTFLPRETKDFLFDILQNNNKFPMRDVEPGKKEENLLLKGEAALTLSLSGYTTSRLTESIKGILNTVVEKPINGSVVEPEPQVSQFSFTFIVSPNAPQPLKQAESSPPQYSKGVKYLIAALYVAYENSNNRNGIAEILKQYRLSKDELVVTARTFKPFKLAELADKLPGNKK